VGLLACLSDGGPVCSPAQAAPAPTRPAAPRAPRQTPAFIVLAVVGGYVGSLFTSFNTWVCLLRKRWSGWFSFRVLEARSPSLGSGAACTNPGSWRE
jgi:hypothetical protein